MTTTPTGQSTTSQPDKDQLYGRFEAGEAWKRQLHRKGAYKALDMADDDMGDIHANRIGMTWKELAVVAALVVGSIMGTAYLMHDPHDQSPSTSPTEPIDSDYEVRFFDAQGKPIRVEPLGERAK